MFFKFTIRLLLSFVGVFGCTPNKSSSEVNVAQRGSAQSLTHRSPAIKIPKIDPNTAKLITSRVEQRLVQGDQHNKKMAVSQTFKDLLLSTSEYIPLTNADRGKQNAALRTVIFETMVDSSVQRSKLNHPESLAGIYGYPQFDRNSHFYRCDMDSLSLTAAVMENLIAAVVDELNQMIAKNKILPADSERIARLRGLLEVLQLGYFPRTLADHFLGRALVWRDAEHIDLPKTLAQSRKTSLPSANYFAAKPTEQDILKARLKTDDLKFVYYITSPAWYYIVNRIDRVKGDRAELPGNFDKLELCFAMMCKAWTDIRQDLARFDKILQSLPRSPGYVYRGVASFPKEKLEKWLALGAHGKPLTLGMDNKPQPVFTSRDIQTALLYQKSETRSPDHYQVLFEIEQKNGVSVELIADFFQKEVILTSNQRFKIVEIFASKENGQEVFISLKEI